MPYGAGRRADITSSTDSMSRVSAPSSRASVVITVSIAVVGARHEEGRRRQLVWVPGHDGLVGAHQRADGVGWGHLAGLVEDDHVKAALRREQLGHHQGAHGPAGLDRSEHVWCGLEQLADGQMCASSWPPAPQRAGTPWDRRHGLR